MPAAQDATRATRLDSTGYGEGRIPAENITLTPTTTAPRPQRYALRWQDLYGALALLRCWADPDEGIEAVALEQDDAPHIEDVVLHFRDGRIEHHQLKHADDPNAVFASSDLFSGPKPEKILLRQLFVGWRHVTRRFPDRPVEVHLDATHRPSEHPTSMILPVVKFQREIVSRLNEDPAAVISPELDDAWSELRRITQADNDLELRTFLNVLRLNFHADRTEKLIARMEDLLVAKVRVPDRDVERVRRALGDLANQLATAPGLGHPHQAADLEPMIRGILTPPHRVDHRLALPRHHVIRREVVDSILARISAMQRGYLLVSGPPGCGKTTLATYVADQYPEVVMLRYHAFHPDEQVIALRGQRAQTFSLVSELWAALRDRYPRSVGPKHYSPDSAPVGAKELWAEVGKLASLGPRVVLIDGIDHVLRAGVRPTEALLEALPRVPPPGVIFLLFGQPGWAYPSQALSGARVDQPPFTRDETLAYVCARFGWSDGDHTADVVVDALQDKTLGNPLSLFYNLELLADSPEPRAIVSRLKDSRLIGSRPHEHYEQLIDDLRGSLRDAATTTRTLCDVLMAFFAVAQLPVTTDILLGAFQGDLRPHQAEEVLSVLRPVLIRPREDAEEGWEIFHDDFRRFLEERCDANRRREAHRRHAVVLAANWKRGQLLPLAVHLWYGDEVHRLADLVPAQPLTYWLETADLAELAGAARLSVAAAIRTGELAQIAKAALAWERIVQVAPPTYDVDGYSRQKTLRAWSFEVPPAELDWDQDWEGIRRVATALFAAAREYATDPVLAETVAKRFRPPKPIVLQRDEHRPELEWYLQAETELLLASGRPQDLAALIGTNLQAMRTVGARLRERLGSERNGLRAQVCVAGLGEAALDLAYHLMLASLDALIQGRVAVAAGILGALLAHQDRFIPEAQRDLLVLAALAGIDAPWPEGARVVAVQDAKGLHAHAEHWFEFFATGFTAARFAPVPDPDLIERSGQRAHHRDAVAALVWRSGVLAGLLMRNPDLISWPALRQHLESYLDPRPRGVELSDIWSIGDCGRAYGPMLARGCGQSSELATALADWLVNGLDVRAARLTTRLYTRLEMLAAVSSAAWVRQARIALERKDFAGSEPEDRDAWFSYWREGCAARDVALPPDFEAREALARLGVAHKSDDPSSLAMDLLVQGPLSVETGRRVVGQLLGLLNKQDDEGAGARALPWQIPRLLAWALAHDPPLFAAAFAQVAARGLAEPFGSLPGALTLCWENELTGAPPPSPLVLRLLWCWLSTSPPACSRDDHRPAEIERLLAWIARHHAALAEELREPTAALVSQAVYLKETVSEQSGVDEGILQIKDITPAWFRYASSPERRWLEGFLSAGGDGVWRQSCEALAWNVAEGTELYPHTLEQMVEGMVRLRQPVGAARDALMEVALDHLREKVRAQPEAGESDLEVDPSLDAPTALLRVLVLGLNSFDVEVLRRVVRALVRVRAIPELGQAVEVALCELTGIEDDDDVVELALVLLRTGAALGQETLARVRALQQHPRAACRWLAATIVGEPVTWDRASDLWAGQHLIAAGVQRLRPDGETPRPLWLRIRESQIERLLGLLNPDDAGQTETTLRARLDVIERGLLPGPLSAPFSEEGRGEHRSASRVGDAAGRLVVGVCAEVDPGLWGPLIAQASMADPWLLTSPSEVAPPEGWIELCAAEERAEGKHEVHHHRTLALVPTDPVFWADYRDEGRLAEVIAKLLYPEVPNRYPWISEAWPAAAEPPSMKWENYMPRPLGAWCDTFPALKRSHFHLIPRWWLPPLATLRYERRDRPCFVHPERGVVIAAARREWNEDSEDLGYGQPLLSWSNAWYAAPGWLAGALLTKDLKFVGVERRCVFSRRGRANDPAERVEFELRPVPVECQ